MEHAIQTQRSGKAFVKFLHLGMGKAFQAKHTEPREGDGRKEGKTIQLPQ